MAALENIVDALLPEWPALTTETRAEVSAHCAQFVRRQIGLSPGHIQLGIRILLLSFSAFAFLRLNMRPFGSTPRGSHISQLPVLERVLRSLTLVAFLEHPDVIAAIDRYALPKDNRAGSQTGSS